MEPLAVLSGIREEEEGEVGAVDVVSSASDDGVPRRGITLAGLRALVARVREAAGLTTTEGLTTQMVSDIAKSRLTLERRCACVDLLDGDAALVREPPTVFISHTWLSPFDALLDVVSETDRMLRARNPGPTPELLDRLCCEQPVRHRTRL